MNALVMSFVLMVAAAAAADAVFALVGLLRSPLVRAALEWGAPAHAPAPAQSAPVVPALQADLAPRAVARRIVADLPRAA